MDFLVGVLQATIRAGTPILLAATGSILVERSGVMNLGIEGIMLMGAIGGFATAITTSNLFLALLVAALMGAMLGLIHAWVSISLRVNQVVSGLAIAMLGGGISGIWGRGFIGRTAARFEPIPVPLLSEIPLLGPTLFRQDLLVYASLLLVIALWVFLFRTRGGMVLRSVGEAPDAADARGISVYGVRYLATVCGCAIVAIGGAYLSLAYTSMWIENMTAGRGWITVALVIFSTWDPLKALLGAYIFGGVTAIQLRLQTIGVNISSHILMMFPYLATLIVIVLFNSSERIRRRMGVPSQLGIPYSREDKS
jgi:simple sugar transport system permease protein